MSEQQHPLDEPWDDLPLPNAQEAWQKMKRLLDEDEEQRRFLPLWFWRFGVLGLLLLGAATGGYFLLKQSRQPPSSKTLTNKTGQPEEIDSQTTVRIKTEKQNNRLQSAPLPEGKMVSTKAERTMSQMPVEKPLVVVLEMKQVNSKNKTAANVPKRNSDVKPSGIAPIENAALENGLSRRKPTVPTERLSKLNSAPGERVPADFNVSGKDKTAALVTKKPDAAPGTVHQNKETKVESLKPAATTESKDSRAKADTTALIAAPPVVGSQPKKAKMKNRYLFSYGVGLQQAIALSGQRSSSYNLKGNESRLSDYIPSVYLRLQKEKWFLQAEAHYNTPQPVESFSFSQASSYNSFSAQVNTEKMAIQKLYYHQLPVTINYFLLPNWSLGAGGTYNLLAGAVTAEETARKNVSTGSETTETRIAPVKGYRDSFLYKSTAGLLLQTDYHWKRISIGLRYTKNLQPFIKYTTPDGAVLNEKNQMLQAVLRFKVGG